MEALQVAVVTPTAEMLRMQAISVSLPTQDGEITVLPGHANALATLGMGTVYLRHEHGAITTVFVAEGFVEASAERVVILAERAEDINALDPKRAEASLRDATAKLALHAQDSAEWQLQDKRRRRAEARLAAIAAQNA